MPLLLQRCITIVARSLRVISSKSKYHSPEITKAYKTIEKKAEHELLNLLPEGLKEDYRASMIEEELPKEHKGIIKAADTISAYLKCKMEVLLETKSFLLLKKILRLNYKRLQLCQRLSIF